MKVHEIVEGLYNAIGLRFPSIEIALSESHKQALVVSKQAAVVIERKTPATVVMTVLTATGDLTNAESLKGRVVLIVCAEPVIVEPRQWRQGQGYLCRECITVRLQLIYDQDYDVSIFCRYIMSKLETKVIVMEESDEFKNYWQSDVCPGKYDQPPVTLK